MLAFLVCTHKLQQSKAFEVKVQQIQFIGRVRTFRCAQRRVHTVHIAEQTVVILQVQFLDEPVVVQGQVSVEILQMQFLNKVVFLPVLCKTGVGSDSAENCQG